MQALLPDWAASRFRSARALLLYGQRRQREGGAGVEVELGAAYRPKQRGGEGGGASVERDPLLPAADAAARALGLVRVGWAVAEGAEQRTGGQRHSAAFAARLQSAFPDADAPPRSVASRFVTVSLRGDADTGRVDVRAWQVSDQTAALARDGLLTAGAKDGGSAHRDGVAAEAGSEGLLPVQGAGSPHVAPLRVATRLPRDALLALAAGEAGEADTVAAATAAAAAPTPAPGVPLSLALVPVPVVGDAAEAAPDTTRAAWLWEEGPDVPVTHVVAGAAGACAGASAEVHTAYATLPPQFLSVLAADPAAGPGPPQTAPGAQCGRRGSSRACGPPPWAGSDPCWTFLRPVAQLARSG